MFKRLGALLGLWPLVWAESRDASVVLRVVRSTPFGKSTIRRFVSSSAEHRLFPLGLFHQYSNFSRWKEWKYNRKHVTFDV